jgi:2-oxoglutarate dehydrogenase complex dehydrogenase (E1) component-like enzyme
LEFYSTLAPGRGNVQILNSPLTENATMAYEYGFAIDNPLNFVCWEAQFGDFFNTAQEVIDTFLVNS